MTTLIDPTLTQYWPQAAGAANENFMPWVYGPTSTYGSSSTWADTGNRGFYRRAIMWDGTNVLTFSSGATWPSAITTGTYEVYIREDPTRILEAINSAVGQLSLWWYREFVDTSITTATQTWTYAMPSAQYTATIWQIEYQVDTNVNDIGFPYADAKTLDWELREAVDTNGNLTQTIQFAVLPPPNRTLRIRGEAYFPDLVNDGDVLAIAGRWERPCLGWIYKYAMYLLDSWLAERVPQGDAMRYEQRESILLQEAEQLKNEMRRAHKPGRIVVPGKGRGLLGFPNLADSPQFLAGFNSP